MAALRKTLARGLCHVGAASPAPAPAYGLRRFLQKRPTFQPALPPDRRVPLADRIRDLYPARIRLDGLAPPPEHALAPATPAASLTVEEARKVLRAVQMEAARERLRAAAAATSCLSYGEFERICGEAAGSGSGARVARALEESGSVIVLGKNVFLRPDMVVQAMEKAIPPAYDPLRRELKEMEARKAEIDRAAASQVHTELRLGLGFLLAQTLGLMRLTFWELSWDVMEPICFFVTSAYFLAGYAFFLRTKKEPSFQGFFESRFETKQRRLMQERGFDLARFNELRRACGFPPLRHPCPSSHQTQCNSYCYCH